MAYRTVNYATCHRCKGANDRGSQRTCKSCNAIIQREFREARAKELAYLRERVAYLEDRNVKISQQLGQAEALLDSYALRKVSREMAA